MTASTTLSAHSVWYSTKLFFFIFLIHKSDFIKMHLYLLSLAPSCLNENFMKANKTWLILKVNTASPKISRDRKKKCMLWGVGEKVLSIRVVGFQDFLMIWLNFKKSYCLSYKIYFKKIKNSLKKIKNLKKKLKKLKKKC